MCCVVAGKREDQQMEQMRLRRQKQGEPTQIQFRDMEGTKRFILLDGESLCMMAEDGTKQIGLCLFVDEKQVDVHGQLWEIGEFLWQMERRGIPVSYTHLMFFRHQKMRWINTTGLQTLF